MKLEDVKLDYGITQLEDGTLLFTTKSLNIDLTNPTEKDMIEQSFQAYITTIYAHINNLELEFDEESDEIVGTKKQE